MSATKRRCIGCGYYEDEIDAKPPSPYGCEGGDGYTGHVLVDVDEAGMAIPRLTPAICK